MMVRQTDRDRWLYRSPSGRLQEGLGVGRSGSSSRSSEKVRQNEENRGKGRPPVVGVRVTKL